MKSIEIINSEGRQLIRLPDEYRLEATEVYVKRLGRSLLLIPTDSDPWDIAAIGLHEFTTDFMQVREQPSDQLRPESNPVQEE